MSAGKTDKASKEEWQYFIGKVFLFVSFSEFSEFQDAKCYVNTNGCLNQNILFNDLVLTQLSVIVIESFVLKTTVKAHISHIIKNVLCSSRSFCDGL